MFQDTFKGIYLGGCCKAHDNAVGEMGTFNPISPHTNFYKCLRYLGVSRMWSFTIAVGAGVGSLIRYPYFVYRKIKFRRGVKNDK